MSLYLNAAIMLLLTIAGFVAAAKLMQFLRAGRFALPRRRSEPAAPSLLTVEQTCSVDGKRRLLLVRFGEHRALLLTGGPSDLVVSVLPAPLASTVTT